MDRKESKGGLKGFWNQFRCEISEVISGSSSPSFAQTSKHDYLESISGTASLNSSMNESAGLRSNTAIHNENIEADLNSEDDTKTTPSSLLNRMGSF